MFYFTRPVTYYAASGLSTEHQIEQLHTVKPANTASHTTIHQANHPADLPINSNTEITILTYHSLTTQVALYIIHITHIQINHTHPTILSIHSCLRYYTI